LGIWNTNCKIEGFIVKNYFERLAEQTVTQFYINNPTLKQAKDAIALGATGCTNNPAFTWKMINDPEEQNEAKKLLVESIKEASSSDDIVPLFQRKMVKPLQKLFYPIWEKSHGKYGYVSIQGDPIREHDVRVIIDEARENRKLGPNICIKIPVTESGLAAIETLVAEDTPINATEIMSISQGISVCDAYVHASSKSRNSPAFFVSFIAGIFDEYMMGLAKKLNSNIPQDIIRQGGMAGMRKMYRIISERGYPGTIISGGARELYHFTELVGANIIGTINWNGTMDKLLECDPDVVYRFFNPVASYVIDTLQETFPDFRKFYEPCALHSSEYEKFGPVVFFRNSFVSAWNNVINMIKVFDN
jgi:transaldolase